MTRLRHAARVDGGNQGEGHDAFLGDSRSLGFRNEGPGVYGFRV